MKLFLSKSLITSLGSLMLLLDPAIVQAKPIIYDFTVQVTEGALQGNSFRGFFSYDDETLTREGLEKIGIEQGLRVCMTFFDQTYDETDDSNYPQFPQLVLNEGEVKSLDFWIEENKRVKWWNAEGWQVNVMQRPSSTELPPCKI